MAPPSKSVTRNTCNLRNFFIGFANTKEAFLKTTRQQRLQNEKTPFRKNGQACEFRRKSRHVFHYSLQNLYDYIWLNNFVPNKSSWISSLWHDFHGKPVAFLFKTNHGADCSLNSMLDKNDPSEKIMSFPSGRHVNNDHSIHKSFPDTDRFMKGEKRDPFTFCFLP